MPMHYSLSPFRANNITTGTNNTYPIYLSGLPKGNGTYQQLITINNYSKYGINDNGSNIEFFDSSNYTHLYAWIQNINATSLQVWIKNYNASNIIDMQVLPYYENLFSANGYLGEAPQLSLTYAEYDNGINVFLYYWNFSGTNFPSGWHISQTSTNSTYNFNNGYYSKTGNSGYFSISTNMSINPSQLMPEAYVQIEQSSQNMFGSFIELSGSQMQFGVSSVNPSFWFYYANYSGASGFTNLSYTSGYILLSMYAESGIRYFGQNNNYISYSVSNSIESSGFAFYVSANNSILNAKYVFFRETMSIMPTFTIGTSLYHSIDFKLIGSSTSINWGIFINGTFYNANSSNIYLNMTNGYYNIIVNLPAGYSPIANNVLKVNNTNQIFKIVVVSQNNNSNFSNDIMYAIILASIIIAVALYFSRRN